MKSEIDIKEELLDYQNWVSANRPKKFSILDYIHAKLNADKVTPDLAVAIFKLCWPDFHEVHGLVFLKEEFSEEKYQKMLSENQTQIEYWMNLVCIDSILASLTFESQKSIASPNFRKPSLSLSLPTR